MMAVDVSSTEGSLLQIILSVVAFSTFVGVVVAAVAFVGLLARDHVKTYRKRPVYRAALR